MPTSTKDERKQYSKFRKNLINLGFSMVQFSVYARTTRNNDDAKKYAKYIKGILPPKGSIRMLTITDRQYDSMEILLGDKYAEENYLDKRDIIEL
ncbi:MAG: CRISPR-associated endonuclease Cas2 [Oscillospiraceae bacterium]|nr:CRISPR-associated endonuclease Cas2 [Oscillospiraceae bacterium]